MTCRLITVIINVILLLLLLIILLLRFFLSSSRSGSRATFSDTDRGSRIRVPFSSSLLLFFFSSPPSGSWGGCLKDWVADLGMLVPAL